MEFRWLDKTVLHNRHPFISFRLVEGQFFKHKLSGSNCNLFERWSCCKLFLFQAIAGPQKCLAVWSSKRPKPLLLCEYNTLKADNLWDLWSGRLGEWQAVSGYYLIAQVKHCRLFVLCCSSLAHSKLEPKRIWRKKKIDCCLNCLSAGFIYLFI